MYKRILVAVDGSATSDKALTTALDLARESHGSVRVVHLIDDAPYFDSVAPYGSGVDLLGILKENGQRVLDDAAQTAKQAGVEVEQELCERFGERLGEVVAESARAWNADLIVLGTHGRRGIKRMLLGSGAEAILRMAPVAVLVVRSDAAQAQ